MLLDKFMPSQYNGVNEYGYRTYNIASGPSGPSQSTTYATNVPEWLRPQTETAIGAAMQEYFNLEDVTDPETGQVTKRVTGIKPFIPYSTRPTDYLADFSPLQQQVQFEAANMMRPGQFDYASQLAATGGAGGLETAQQAGMYGAEGAGFGRQGARIGEGALDYGAVGARIGRRGVSAAEQGFGAGSQYERMATDPGAIQAYMSPYMQNVVNTQKQAAIRDYQENIMPQLQAQAARAGALGGSRDAVQRAIAQRNLSSQLQGIEATGLQKAFEDAQKSQQFGSQLGLQGLQAGMQGLQTGIQGQQAGMQGIQGALAGTAQGMQGAQVGLQGVSGAQAGYGMGAQAGRTLADIGTAQQASDIARMQLQGQIGGTQQEQQQKAINQAIQNYAMGREYPFEQLSRFSGLLRGYYTPTTTATTYQAPPSITSQIAGAGMTAAALQGLNKAKGGKIKESSGIDDLVIRKTLKRVAK